MKIRYLVLLGLLASWAARQKKSRSLRAAANSEHSEKGLSTLVSGLPPTQGDTDQVPSAANPFPAGNPTPLPTGPAPGG